MTSSRDLIDQTCNRAKIYLVKQINTRMKELSKKISFYTLQLFFMRAEDTAFIVFFFFFGILVCFVLVFCSFQRLYDACMAKCEL